LSLSSEVRSQMVNRLFSQLRERGFTISPASASTGDFSDSPAGQPKTTGSLGQVVTEADVEDVAKTSGETVLRIPQGVIVTPLARERASDLGVEIRSP